MGFLFCDFFGFAVENFGKIDRPAPLGPPARNMQPLK